MARQANPMNGKPNPAARKPSSSAHIEIRIAGVNDAAVIARISREAFAEFAGRVHPPFRALAATPESVRQEMTKLRFVYGLALLDGTPVGHLRYRPRDGHLHISRLAVLPACRGRGIGRALMHWVEQEAHSLGVLHVRGEVRSVLLPLLRYYQSLGYEATGTRSLEGVPQCLTIIEKWLDGQPAGAQPDPEPVDEQPWVEEAPVAWELLHPVLASMSALRTQVLSKNSR